MDTFARLATIVVISSTLAKAQDLEINDKCIFTLNKHILTCTGLIDVATNVDGVLTPNTQVLILNGSDTVNLSKNHHDGKVYRHVKRYDIKDSKKFNIQSFAFTGLTNVHYMNINGNIYPRIKGNTFFNMTNLIILNLSNNGIKGMDQNAFIGINELKSLDLSMNSVTTIPAAIFENLGKLEELYLTHNYIRILELNAFKGLKSLSLLQMTNNSLEKINTRHFDIISNLENLQLDFNKVRYIEGIFSLKNLKFVQLSNNIIMDISKDLYSGSRKLISIDLARNKLQNLTEEPFITLPDLRHLNIQNNNIAKICPSYDLNKNFQTDSLKYQNGPPLYALGQYLRCKGGIKEICNLK